MCIDMKRESFRVSEELVKKIDTYVKQRGISKTDLFTSALVHFFTCTRVEPSFQLRLIPLRYEASCLLCRKKLEVGAYAMYARGTGAICVDCHQKRFGDKGSVRKYMKVIELDYTLKNLKIQCDEKAEQLRTFSLYEKIQELFDGDIKIRTLLYEFLREGFADPEQRKVLEDARKLIANQIEVTQKVRDLIRVPLKKTKRKVVR